MLFSDAVARLDPLPAALPEGPGALMPMLREAGAPRPVPGAGAPLPGARTAAVLVLVFPDASGEARVVLTERTDRVGHHSGEVSFPGGGAEPGDASPAATALREAAEEVGLVPGQCGLRVLGALPALWVPVSNHAVTPVVAVAPREPAMRPQPDEVAAILRVSLARFLPGQPLVERERPLRGARLTYGAFALDGVPGAAPGLVVWGMTARVLGSLGAWLGAERPG